VQLARYKVVVFLSTTGDIFADREKGAFERYIRSGGGFAGIHSASDTEYKWAWYGRFIGAYFASHPEIQPAMVCIEDPSILLRKACPQPGNTPTNGAISAATLVAPSTSWRRSMSASGTELPIRDVSVSVS
jgi:Trehalose utilisation